MWIPIVRFSVLVDGGPYWSFGCLRGLKQWDPLIPMLFFFRDGSSKVMDKSININYLIGFTGSLGEQCNVRVSNLLFLDDTIFHAVDLGQLTHLKQVLMWF